MDNTRERLIELLEEIPHPQRLYPELYVDRLIANGVIIKSDCEDCASKTTRIIDELHGEIAKARKAPHWIPVTDGVPTKEDAKVIDEYVLAIVKGRKPNLIKWNEVAAYRHYFTHWMSIPQPPKGE
jgi:hypothetical protein